MDRGCANAVMSDRAAGGWAWENLGADVAQSLWRSGQRKADQQSLDDGAAKN